MKAMEEIVEFLGEFCADKVACLSKKAIGNSGRVVSIWDKNMFLAELKISDQRFILVRGWWIQNGTLAMIINVYAPCVISEHIDRWALLINRRQSDNIF
ncbi:hypothetical protein V6N13_068779 [Hibiscus sabdariffa]